MPVILNSKSRRRNASIDQDADLIGKSLKRFTITAEAEAEWRGKALEDLKFSIGTGQWDESVKSNREIEGKPCLTINRAPAFLRQYTGEERQHRPSMLVSPVGSGSDVETAKIHQGVLRHVEVASIAEVTYDNSYDMMMRIGSCPWRVRDSYVNEMSFDREPRIEPIENPFSVFLSPVRRPDGTDPLWGHVVTDYSHDDYIAEFGETDLVRLNFPTQMGNAEPGWVTKDGARVVEYWWMDLQKKVLCLLDDGTTVLEENLKTERDEGSGKFRRHAMKDRVIDRRDTIIRKVNCVIHDAIRVIKKHDYLGKYLPFPEVSGVRLNVNGKIHRSGMVRDYRDAQRIYDFMVTRQVEQVDMVSKDPLWVPEENAQYGEDYRQMNRKNFSHLFYKAYTKDGKQLPVPQRAGREAPIQAMSEVIKQADYDMKAVVGIYGPSLGEEAGSTQESGFAIMTRQSQSDTGTLTWHDNLNRAILWQGVILLDLWPKLIPAARVQRIINPDDSVKHAVVFNSQYSQLAPGGLPPGEARALLNQQMGLKKAYDIGAGIYDLTLSTGPMNKTARQEAFKALTVVISQKPELLSVIGDVWAKNADFQDHDVLESRFKKMLPPNLQDADNEDPQAKLVVMQGQLAALSAQHNQLVQELNRASDTIRTKRLDLESKERIALWNAFTQLTLQRMKTADAGAAALLDQQLQAISMRMMGLHENLSIEQDAGEAPPAPELPGQVEPKPLRVTPGAPTPPPQMIPTPTPQPGLTP